MLKEESFVVFVIGNILSKIHFLNLGYDTEETNKKCTTSMEQVLITKGEESQRFAVSLFLFKSLAFHAPHL